MQEEGNGQQPGQVIEPHKQTTDPPQRVEQPAASPPSQTPSPEPDTGHVSEAAAQWQFNSDTTSPSGPNQPVAPNRSGDQVSWTASEFVANDKAMGWYGLLGLAGVVGAALVYLVTRDWISTAMIGIVTVVFGMFAARKPRVLTYSLDHAGIQIGNKFYPYGDFKSFSILEEGQVNGLWLMPLKRFAPPITMYYAPDDENKITDVLSIYLPFEQREHDVVDRLMRRVRF